MLHRKGHKRLIVISIAVVVFISSAVNCSEEIDSSPYDRIKAHIDTIKVVNTHEHQRIRREYKGQNFTFYTNLGSSYLRSDLVSAGAPEFKPEVINNGNLDELWDIYGRYLDFCRNTSYYGHLLRGFQVLYGYDAPYFTMEGIESLSENIAANYSNTDEWYAKAFAKAGFEIMIVDPYWDPFDIDLDQKYFALAFNIDGIVWDAAERKRMTVEKDPVIRDWIEEFYFQNTVYKSAQKDDFTVENFDNYLIYANIFLLTAR